jgi:hypothetical protein
LTINYNTWRDQQLGSFADVRSDAILAQELTMLNFVKMQGHIKWKWLGDNTKFKTICQQQISIADENAQGVILFGKRLNQLTTTNLISMITKTTHDFDYAYVAINRYEVTSHDYDLVLPNSIADSLDLLMTQCNPGFRRLCTFEQVDGNHMVAAHPMDCYGLCKL